MDLKNYLDPTDPNYIPWYQDDADYNTNAKSFSDALARNKKFLRLFTEEITRLNKQLILEFGDFKDVTNLTIKQFNDRLDGIKEEMKDFFNQWLADGVLDEVINQDIFNNLNEKATKALYRTSNSVTPEEFGATATPTTDNSIAIQSAIDSFGTTGGTVIFNGAKKYGINKTIFVPWNVNLEFNFTEIVPLAPNTFTNNYLFYLNADSSGVTKTNWGGDTLQFISKLIIKNPNNVQPCNVFFNRSRVQIKTALIYNVTKFLLKTGSADRDYSDMITLEGIFLNNCVGTEWLIDLQYNGDGLKIDNCHVAGVSAGNWKFLSARFCTGGIIDRQINGDLLFRDCIGISVRSSHFEHGAIEVVNSSVSFESIYHWYHAEWQPIPITFRSVSGKHTKPSSMKNYFFIYYQDRNSIAKTYQNDHFNVAVIDGVLDLVNVMRRSVANLDISLGMETGIRLTTDGTTENGMWGLNKGWYSRQSTVSRSDVYTSIDKARHSTNYEMYDLAITNHGTFDLPTGVYYYRAVAYFGPINRKIGRYLGSEVKATIASKATVPKLNIVDRASLQNATIRLYRGLQPGVYTHVVDIHIANGLSIYDLGYQVATGEMWQTRTPSGINPYNGQYTETILQGENVIVKGIDTPTTGEWLQGDVVEGFTPSNKQDIICIATGQFDSVEDPAPIFITK